MHGYHFKSQDLQNYFTQYRWYKTSPNFSESDFNETERKNIALIRKMENMTEPLVRLFKVMLFQHGIEKNKQMAVQDDKAASKYPDALLRRGVDFISTR